MYLQTSRLQYNLQKVGVFQKALSYKNIQAGACKIIISQRPVRFKGKGRIYIALSGKSYHFVV